MSIAKINPSRRSIASHKYDEEQDSLGLNKRINLRYNELQYFRRVVSGRYKSLPLLSQSCCRYSAEALQSINSLHLTRAHVLSHPSTQRLVTDALARISNNRSAKFLDRLEKATKKTEESMEVDTMSYDSAGSGKDTSSIKKKQSVFDDELNSYTQDLNQMQFIKQIRAQIQNEVPLPVMGLVYKEVLPILNGIFQDYKKLLGHKPTEHFMTDDARKQSNEVAACIEAITPS